MNRKIHPDPNCYCEDCCATASAWLEWRNGLTEGSSASGSRYWTLGHAFADFFAAQQDGFTILVHQPTERVVADIVSLGTLVTEEHP